MGALKVKVVVPVTDATRSVREWHAVLKKSIQNGLDKDSVADCFQIKSISKDRFISRRGELSEEEMNEIKLGMMKVLNLL